jgi:hypothetical protein
MDMETELRRTEPDYVVFVPRSLDGSTNDNGNEHFLVFDGPDGSLLAVWTHSHSEGYGNHKLVFARSDDEGVTWTPPLRLAGPELKGEGLEASWGFPIVSKSGRIYVFWNQQVAGYEDVGRNMTGTMSCRYSDDCGRSWSEPQVVPMPHSPLHDHPDPNCPGNWIVWQKPERLSAGKYFVGYTRWRSLAVRRPLVADPNGLVMGWSAESVVEFMRFEQIDDDPEPRDIRLSFFAWNELSLRVPHYLDSLRTVAQEPSLVRLPDGRLFCTMRTLTGCIWYSCSSDEGATWCNPRPLLRRDHGEAIQQPISCCPIYEIGAGRYVLIHHLRLEGTRYEEARINRRPAYIALGEFRPGADQPVWFSASKLFMDNAGVPLGPNQRRDVGIYCSMTHRNGNHVLWHPDRKFFLLGKRVTPEFLADLEVPRSRST